MRTSAIRTPLLVAILGALLPAQAQEGSAPPDMWPWQSFKSSPATPPKFNITKTGPTAPGYLFITPNGVTKASAPFIMDESGDLIWQGPEGTQYNFEPQMLNNQPVISYWNGTFLPDGIGYGDVTILNNRYQPIHNITFTPKQGYILAPETVPKDAKSFLDIHESRITQQGTILVTVENMTQYDLTAANGPKDGWILDSLFFEIDIKTNDVLFRWSSLEHIDDLPFKDVNGLAPIGDQGKNKTQPWGYFHINSVDKFQDGSYLVNSRHYCAFLKVLKNGTVDWILQGRDGGDFDLGPELSFGFEHDARIQQEYPDGKLDVTLFDDENGNFGPLVNSSRGLFLKVDPVHKKAYPEKVYADPKQKFYATSQGSMRNLNPYKHEVGHYIVGFGDAPFIQEFTSGGEPVLTIQYGGDGEDNYVMSYRAFRSSWAGFPTEDPAVFAELRGNQTDVYMSWNGATEYKAWTVLAGNEKEALYPAGVALRTGFETKKTIPGRPKYVRVEANGGGVFGQSAITPVSSNATTSS